MGCCFDVLDGPSGRPDDRLRPNQWLLTRHGLRTLDPADPDDRGHYGGDAPHDPRGCIAQAWSVAEVLAAWTAISGGTPRVPVL